MYEKITDPIELAEAAKAWEYVKELQECDLLDPELADDAESMAMVRGVFERARSDAVRDYIAAQSMPASRPEGEVAGG